MDLFELPTSNLTNLVDLPAPIFEVCGADVDKVSYWNKINGSFKELLDNELLHSSYIISRYFKKPLDNFELIARPSLFISQNICTETPKCESCPLKFNCSYFKDQVTPKHEITFADFFCGAGGLSLGFEWAGLYPVLANDIDPWFVATYKYNRPNYNIEIDSSDINIWLEEHQFRTNWNIDIVSGGAPCQSFSNANRQRKEVDPRDKLYSSLLRAASLIKPKVILIENVSGMIKEFDGVQNDLKNLGYSSGHVILNSKDYGIPQGRRRLFFIGFSNCYYSDASDRVKKTLSTIENSTVEKQTFLKDAISDLPRLKAHTKNNDTSFNNEVSGKSFVMHSLECSSSYVKEINNNRELIPLFNHKARFNNPRDVEIFDTLKPGENSLAESIRHIMPYSNRNGIFKDKYYKLDFNTYCKTITAHMRYDCNMYIHPQQARGLTSREAARVQSFPDDYVFLGNFQRLYQQVGNAVPPLLAKVLGNAIKINLD